MIIVRITPGELRLAEAQAKACSLGGKSHIRGKDERMAELSDDQIVGQLGTIALHKYWFGTLDRYLMSRYVQNQHPHDGDGGDDLLGGNIDVKTSVMRRSQDPNTYNLLVRPRERHDGWVYVLALLPQDWKTEPRVYLMGWVEDGYSPFPHHPEDSGPLAGAYRVSATELLPLVPLRYKLLP